LEIAEAARTCLRRAAGQHGRAELPIKLKTIDDQPCNAATYFEISWYVNQDGSLDLHLFIDGLSFWEGTA